MTTVYMIRHGQSIANAEDRFAGHSDFDLSPLGYAQAECAAEYLAGLPIDAILSSDLKRAYNTALPTAKRLGLPVIPTQDLREIRAGEWEGLTVPQIDERYSKDFDVWKYDFANARPTGGESVAEVYERVCRAVLRLAREYDGKHILLATHGCVVRSILCRASGYGPEGMSKVKFAKNASVNIFTVENETVRTVETDIVSYLREDMVTGVPEAINA